MPPIVALPPELAVAVSSSRPCVRRLRHLIFRHLKSHFEKFSCEKKKSISVNIHVH